MSLLDEYLTQEEIAAELRVTPRTIMRWQQQPDGLPYTKIGARVLYRRVSALQWLQNHERRPNPRRAA